MADEQAQVGQATTDAASAVQAATDATKGEGGQGADAGKGKAADAAAADYADFSLPEGQTLDAELITEFKTLAKSKSLSQEDAQSVVNLGAKMAQKWDAAAQSRFETVRTEWKNQAKADKEIGGQSFDANLGVAKQAIEKFGGKALSDFLDKSGLGDHPEMVRAFFRVGKLITEDGHVGAGAPAGERKDTATVLYGNA